MRVVNDHLTSANCEDPSKYCAKPAGYTLGEYETSLHLASMHDRADVIKTLLKCGADIDARNACGETALHMSSQRGCVNAVKSLLEYGTDINIVCNGGRTPLYYRPNTTFQKCVAQLFRLHMIKMQAANWYVREENLRMIGNNSDTSFLQNDCKNEIERMRKHNIFGNVSYYHILTQDLNKLATYVRMEDAPRALKSDCYKKKFPIYCGWIDTNLRRGQRRGELLEQAADCLNSRIGYKLLNVLTIEICRYISNEDLKNFITASRDRKTCHEIPGNGATKMIRSRRKNV